MCENELHILQRNPFHVGGDGVRERKGEDGRVVERRREMGRERR